MCLFLGQPVNSNGSRVGGDSNAEVEGGLEGIGIKTFRNDNEDRKDDDRDVLANVLLSSGIDGPVFGLDGPQLPHKHDKLSYNISPDFVDKYQPPMRTHQHLCNPYEICVKQVNFYTYSSLPCLSQI